MNTNKPIGINRHSNTKLIFLAAAAATLLLVTGCATAPFPAEDEDLAVLRTPAGVEFVRTPDSYFENLPDWPYEPEYVDIDGLLQAYVDEGTGDSGETILLLHGQPSWSYLYRKMIPVLVDAGHRVIAMDHLGMGRSDKPVDVDYYTYLNHTYRLEQFITKLELENITLFVQDWGSLIGLYVVGMNPDWFARVTVGDGALPEFGEGEIPYPLPEDEQAARDAVHRNFRLIPAQQPVFYDEDGNLRFGASTQNEGAFGAWILYARNDERFRPSVVLEAMTYYPLSREEEAAYDAPFPARIAMGGPRSFPGLANTLGGVTEEAWVGLRSYEKPFLTIWASNDPGQLGTQEAQQIFIDSVPAAVGQPHTRLPEASHFLQDDQGEQIAKLMNQFIAKTRE